MIFKKILKYFFKSKHHAKIKLPSKNFESIYLPIDKALEFCNKFKEENLVIEIYYLGELYEYDDGFINQFSGKGEELIPLLETYL